MTTEQSTFVEQIKELSTGMPAGECSTQYHEGYATMATHIALCVRKFSRGDSSIATLIDEMKNLHRRGQSLLNVGYDRIRGFCACANWIGVTLDGLYLNQIAA